MDLRILNAVPFGRDVAMVEWLKTKNDDAVLLVPLYKAAGEVYGVRWDLAIIQSCLETGFFSFRGDVPAHHNNYAGIGATGGGNPGEKFATPADGVAAQIQHLAVYAGLSIPVTELIADRTKTVQNWILGAAKTFPDLTGRWAADPEYGRKINNLFNEFLLFEKNHLPEQHKYWVGMFNSGLCFLMKNDGEAIDMVDTSGEVDKLAVVAEAFGSKAARYFVLEGEDYPTIVDPDDAAVELPPSPRHSWLSRVRTEVLNINERRVWIPYALDYARMATPYVYADGYPTGAIVHHTAGATIESSLNHLRQVGYPCMGVARDGRVFQPFSLARGGPHSNTWHHRHMVGIENAGWGKLQYRDGKFWAWPENYRRVQVPEHRVRHIPRQNANQQVGYYEMFRPEQESALVELLVWLHTNNPRVFKIDNILGHDEVAPRSKNDPGGSLSMTMPELREIVRDLCKLIL